MPKQPAPNEWDLLVTKVGRLALATGYLEMAVIAMVCRIVGKTEDELDIHSNKVWCKKLEEVAAPLWSDAQRTDLSKRLKKIRNLYLRRNRIIHAALGVAADNWAGVPSGSIIDLRTFGVGFTKRQGNTWTIGVVGKRLHLGEIDKLTDEIHEARVALVPFMELVDEIKHPPKPFSMPALGKLLSS